MQTGTGEKIKYLYDAAGRLVYKRVNGVAQAVFLWQGDNLLAELDGTATVKRAEYSYYPGLDNLHAVVINNERLYAHADGLGNVIALTDEAQAVRRQYGYDDWGTSGGTSGTLALPDADRARWKGALWMGPELDLYYMRNRWYEPETGRFLSEDPIGLQGGINPVVFAGGDPIRGRDPSGLLDCEKGSVPRLVADNEGPGWHIECVEEGALGLPDVVATAKAPRPFDPLGVTRTTTFNPFSRDGGWRPSAAPAGDPVAPGGGKPPVNITVITPMVGTFFGPAFTVTYLPEARDLCFAFGVGASAGRNISGGPLIWGNLANAKAITKGFSASAGVQVTPFRGVQATGNSSGSLGGPTIGTPGLSGAFTYGSCT